MGTQPALDWYWDDVMLEDQPDNSNGVAKSDIRLDADYTMDGATFVCRMQFDSFSEDCSLRLVVNREYTSTTFGPLLNNLPPPLQLTLCVFIPKLY